MKTITSEGIIAYTNYTEADMREVPKQERRQRAVPTRGPMSGFRRMIFTQERLTWVEAV
ncbi:hypothetical protein [Novosphingobium gossypii]|uniref:hypothetical protein n=1 Tax=Novosphingobium gossypii TaxID=1604774 RepID=UPI003D229B0B